MLKTTNKMLYCHLIQIYKKVISYKILTKIKLFKPLAKGGGGSITELAQLQ